MRTREKGVDVLGVGFRPLSRTATIDRAGARPVSRSAKRKGPISAVRPLTRQRVVETAFAFEKASWLVNPGAYGKDPDQAAVRPASVVEKYEQ